MIQDAISKAENIIHWIESNAVKLVISSEPRARVSCACLDLAQEHQKSIVLLIDNHLTGSALSLLRPMFEACIRGIWFHEKASDKEIKKLVTKDILDKTFDALVKDVETTDDWGVGILSEIKRPIWKSLNSFTHCGSSQISRRNTADFIEPNYSDEEKVEVIVFANAVGLLSLLGMARLANDSIELQIEILAKIEEWHPEPQQK